MSYYTKFFFVCLPYADKKGNAISDIPLCVLVTFPAFPGVLAKLFRIFTVVTVAAGHTEQLGAAQPFGRRLLTAGHPDHKIQQLIPQFLHGFFSADDAAGIKIEALFIDEGFGSLDEDSISDAMNILGSIQQANGLVGIISHVQLLQDRIPTKLQVQEVEGGSHIIQTIG